MRLKWCEDCKGLMYQQYTIMNGWRWHCCKCQKNIALTSDNEKPSISIALGEKACRGFSLYNVKKFKEAETTFLELASAGTETLPYLWMALLCKYGITYCSKELSPVIWIKPSQNNLLSETKEFQKLMAIAPQYSEEVMKYYTDQANLITYIQRQILELDSERGCDIFVSYSSHNPDSVTFAKAMKEWFCKISKDTYKYNAEVFFAGESLAGKAGDMFESHIFHALYTAKRLVFVVGKPVDTAERVYPSISDWLMNEYERYMYFHDGDVSICLIDGAKTNILTDEMQNREIPSLYGATAEDQGRNLATTIAMKYPYTITTPAPTTTTNKKKTAITVMAIVIACILGLCAIFKPHQHVPVIIGGTLASCEKNGLTDGIICSVCGKILTQQTIIQATGHTTESILGKAATCTEDGLSDGTKCRVCGEILVPQKVIPAKGHIPVQVLGKAATSTEEGLSEGTKCSVCGVIITTQTVIPATGYSETKTEPTIALKPTSIVETTMTVYINSSESAILRERPDPNSNKIATIAPSTSCISYGEFPGEGSSTRSWYKIEYQGKVGFVTSSKISLTKPSQSTQRASKQVAASQKTTPLASENKGTKKTTTETIEKWSSWSSWQLNSISPSSTVQVETGTQYHYWAAQCKNCGTCRLDWGSNIKCKGCGKAMSRENMNSLNKYFVNDGSKSNRVIDGITYKFADSATVYRYRTLESK